MADTSGDMEFDCAVMQTIKESASFIDVSYLDDKDFEEVSEIKFLFAGAASLENQ